MQGLYKFPGRFRRLLSGGVLTNLENQKQLPWAIRMVNLGVQVSIECEFDHAEKKEK